MTKSNLTNSSESSRLLAEVKDRSQAAQTRVVLAVNTELVRLFGKAKGQRRPGVLDGRHDRLIFFLYLIGGCRLKAHRLNSPIVFFLAAWMWLAADCAAQPVSSANNAKTPKITDSR